MLLEELSPPATAGREPPATAGARNVSCGDERSPDLLRIQIDLATMLYELLGIASRQARQLRLYEMRLVRLENKSGGGER